mmetsp:Transcript_8693/g.22438  ORF Transcript_8693/g.22438 Transcript_8693/m.22438 type:complete len:304 (+) Transcript_8693:266-1177(+)
MKFGKLLRDHQVDEVPNEFKTTFLCYKDLKKDLKGICGAEASDHNDCDNHEPEEPDLPTIPHDVLEQEIADREPGNGEDGDCSDAQATVSGRGKRRRLGLTPQERNFVSKLNAEIVKFNDFFMKKEEELVIRVYALQDKLESRTDGNASGVIQNALDLHGEMVLLLHWCELNYTAVVKILKKHDKKTSLLLRSSFLANVVQQPFYSTMILKDLLKQVESILEESIAVIMQMSNQANGPATKTAEGEQPDNAVDAPSASASASTPDPNHDAYTPTHLLKQVKAAMGIWQALQKSKTPAISSESL